jgi:glucoamylase
MQVLRSRLGLRPDAHSPYAPETRIVVDGPRGRCTPGGVFFCTPPMTDTSSPFAPGWPGIPGRWTSSAKSGIGTAASRDSRVWFTLSHGILNEVYYPRIDHACIRDLGFIVTDGQTLFSEEKRDVRSSTSQVAPGVPAYVVHNTASDGRYRIEKEILTDPHRDVVLQRVRFVPLRGTRDDYRLYVLLAPHLANHACDNTAWVGDFKGIPMLMAQRDSSALALASSVPWRASSAGFVGYSDGWQELSAHKRLVHTYERAENGNVALTGEIDLGQSDASFVLALAFGPTAMEAGQHALVSLMEDFDRIKADYIRGWQSWLTSLHRGRPQSAAPRALYDLSATVLRIHEGKRNEGAVIASLSVPWGFSKGDDDLGGYHLIWPRDLVETATGFLAIGAAHEAKRVVRYLRVTQEPDGHWSQNMWLDGTPYWHGIQMDETALPILLVDLATREGVLDARECEACWPMVRKAAVFLARNGPVSPQDRWEEDGGYSPFTVAAEIAALLVAAEMADSNGESTAAAYLRETADSWNASIERWLYVEGTDLARTHGVDGYYVRVSTPDQADAASPCDGFVPIKNRPPDQSIVRGSSLVSLDALAFVRLGLRAADDPRMLNTVKVIDATLRVELPQGPAWYRYEFDGYGEHADGGAFDGIGIGRPWPLLTGERAHFELASGRRGSAEALLRTLEGFAGENGLLPEQVWDTTDIPERELFLGQPSGSAMPLVWAHAEYLKLCRSLHDGHVFDRPPQTVRRYLVEKTTSDRVSWRFNNKVRAIPPGTRLRIETLAPAVVHWTEDAWRTLRHAAAHDTTLGVYVVDLPTTRLAASARVSFTFYWPDVDRWEGTDFVVCVE